MRKLMILMFSFLIILGLATVSYAKESLVERPDIHVIIDGEMVSSGTPIVINGRTLLPLRDLLTSLGVENDEQHIIWDSVDRSVTAVKDSTTIYLKVGDLNAKINGQSYSIDAAPINYKGKVYIPARFAAEAFSKKVFWDSVFKIIYIRDNAQFDEVKNVLDQSMRLLDQTSNYKVKWLYTNAGKIDSGSITYNTSAEFYKSKNNAYSTTTYQSVSAVEELQSTAETYQCNNQFIYYKDIEDIYWEKAILSTSYDQYLNSNNPRSILPDDDTFYASLIMEKDPKSHLIRFKQAPYISAYLDSMTLQSLANQWFYTYEITIDSQSGYISSISKTELYNYEHTSIDEYTRTYNYYDIGKSFSIDYPDLIKLDLMKTIVPDKLTISNEERSIIESLKESAAYQASDPNSDLYRSYESNMGNLVCILKDQKSLNAYCDLSDNSQIIFCNEIARAHQNVFNLCDGVDVVVAYNSKVYTEMVTGYDFLLQDIEHGNGHEDLDTIFNY